MKHLKAILIDPIVRHPYKFLALILFGAVHKVVADLNPEHGFLLGYVVGTVSMMVYHSITQPTGKES